MKKTFYCLGTFILLLWGCNNQQRKSKCVCTTTYSGEGSEYFEDETVYYESYNGCENSDVTMSEDGLNIRMVCKEE